MRHNDSDPLSAGISTDTAQVWTEQRIRALGAITDIPTAGSIFGLGRARAYELAKDGGFPVPVIAVGARFKVPVAGILAALGLPASGDLTEPAKRSVDHHDPIRSPDPRHPAAPHARVRYTARPIDRGAP